MPRDLSEEERDAYDRGMIRRAEDEVSLEEMGLTDVPTGERDYIGLLHDVALMIDKVTDIPIRQGRRIYHFLYREECTKCGEVLGRAVRCQSCQTPTPQKRLDDWIFGFKRGAQLVGRIFRGIHNWDPGRRYANQTIANTLSVVSGRVSAEKVIAFRRLYKTWKREFGMPTLGKKIREEGIEAANKEYLQDIFTASLEYLREKYPMSDDDLIKANEMAFQELVEDLDAARSPVDEILSRQIVKPPPWTGEDRVRASKAKRLRLEI